jgi:signal transduction histidine kinase
MVVLATLVPMSRPVVAAGLLVAVAAWNAAVTIRRAWGRPIVRWVDLFVSLGLLLVGPAVMERGSLGGDQPLWVIAYPMASILTWAAATGVVGGVTSAAILALAVAISRPINGVDLDQINSAEAVSIVTGGIYYLMGGASVGLLARTLDRAAADLRRANDTATRERERVARLQEREMLAREIHDSVLQSLALVRKRGRELAARDSVPGNDVAELVQVADDQERGLRQLLQRTSEEPPEGSVPLRTVLEAATYGIRGIPVTVTTVDPLWLPADDVRGFSAAVRQALENVVQHARASSATVFAEEAGDDIVVSVRDDGVGFDIDEEQLRRDGRLGILRSMRGRIQEMGGQVRINSTPGRGTEIEFRLPLRMTPPFEGAP